MQKKVNSPVKCGRQSTRSEQNQEEERLLQDMLWMRLALEEAKTAALHGEVPVGAVLIDAQGLLATAGNSPIRLADPTAHAEILALREAAKSVGNYRIPGTTLYVTLEPCIMCMGALIHARVERLVYGADDPKTGAVSSVYTIGSDNRLNHHLAVTGGIFADECASLLRTFFQSRR